LLEPALSRAIGSASIPRSAVYRGFAVARGYVDHSPLLYGVGLRMSEALALTMADVDLDAGVVCIRHSKFYKSRLVPIGDDLLQISAPYAARRRQQHAGAASPFFVSRRGTAVIEWSWLPA
jgi:site-specific recombinase XerC